MKLRTRITVLSVVVLVGLAFTSASAGAKAVDGARMGQAGSAIPAAAPGLEDRAGTIVGGVPARPGDWPYVAHVEWSGDGGETFADCGGSLIGERWVLTAAHCVTDDDGNFYSDAVNRISIGWYDLTKIPPDGYTFADVYYIGDYSPGVNKSNDWALLRLASPVVNWPAIRFANATEAPQAAPGTPAAIVGWGATSEGGDGSDILLEAAVPILADQVCTSHYAGDFIARVMLCAGYLPGGIDTCQGDSGGPIFINDGFDLPLQVGIVSFGDGCARADIPGVYVRASGVAQDLVATMKADGVAPVDGPTATAGTITNQVRGRATVRITADANGLATAAVVEFGGSRNLGSFVSGYVGASQQQQLELRLRNLKPGKKYFYRTTVMSGAGAQTGPLRSFVAVGSDSKAPTVRAIASAGNAGSIIRLYYTIFDNVSERTREKLTVYRTGGPAIAVLRTNLSQSVPGTRYWYNWRASVSPGLYRFCVVGYDTNGNASAPSCAPVRVR